MSGDTLVQFVVNFIANDELHPDIVDQLSKTAGKLTTKKDIENWLKKVKGKLGRSRYMDMKKQFSNHVKFDAGFIDMNPEDIFLLLEMYDNVTTFYL